MKIAKCNYMEEELWEFVAREIIPVLGSGVQTSSDAIATPPNDLHSYLRDFFLVIKTFEIDEVY